MLGISYVLVNAGSKFFQRNTLVSGSGIHLCDLTLILGVTDPSANLDEGGGDIYLGMISKAITDNKGATILVVDVLTLEAGGSIEVDGLDRISRSSDSKSSRKDEFVPSG